MSKKKQKSSRPITEQPVSANVTRGLPVLKTGTDSGFFSYADEKCTNYTYAFHQLYKRTDESEDKGFQSEIKQRFSMCTVEYRSCETDATALRNSEIELDAKGKVTFFH